MRRWLLWFLILIFLVAGLFGCQKRLRIVPPSAQENGINKYAHIIIDVCDPANHYSWLEPKSEPEKFVRLTCAAGMEKMAEKMEKIQNEKLKKLILKYRESNFR